MVNRMTRPVQHLMIVSAYESLMLIARTITHDPTLRVLGRKYSAAGLLEMHLKSIVHGPSPLYPSIYTYLQQWLDDAEADELGDRIHDSILVDCRPIITLESGEQIVQVVVQDSGDVHVVIEQTNKLEELAQIHAEALGIDPNALLGLMRNR